jgi:sugar phosphate isomerase/epimerase
MSELHPILFSTGSLYMTEISTCFQLAKEAGFDGLEIIVDQRWSTRSPEILNSLIEQYQLPVKVIHNPFFINLPKGVDSQDPLKVLQSSVDLAKAVTAESIVLHLPAKEGQTLIVSAGTARLGFTPNNPERKLYRWIKSGGLREYQSACEINICVENMPKRKGFLHPRNSYHWNNIADWAHIHDHLTLDTTHWGTFGLEPLDAFQAANGHVRHVHLSNFNGQEHQLPENGSLNLAGLLQAIAREDRPISVTFESHPGAVDYQNEDNLKRNLNNTVAFMRKHLG